MKRLAVIGAGGHAKVVVATAIACGWEIEAVVDDARERWGEGILGHDVSGPCAHWLANRDATCVIAIGDNAARRRLAASAHCRFATLVHPMAFVHDSVRVGEGSVVFAGAVVQPDTVIGAHSIINTSASVDHDCTLGSGVHIAPGARLAGGVTIGDETFIGIGAAVIPAIRIGSRCVVGAGAVVVRDLPDAIVATGVPARPR